MLYVVILTNYVDNEEYGALLSVSDIFAKVLERDVGESETDESRISRLLQVF